MSTAAELPWQELHSSLQAFVRRRVRNPADTDDLVQAVLLQIVRNIGSLRDTERLHAWVYRTARNAIADYYRAPVARRELSGGVAEDLEAAGGGEAKPPNGEDEDETAALRELATCLTPMLAQLPQPYREAIRLADLDGMNQADAAQQVGVSLSGMKSRVQRGRRQLKAVLEACCRVDLDQRGSIKGYERRPGGSCSGCS